jgi:hypothetical protein
VAKNGIQCPRQLGPGAFEFRPVSQCQPAQGRTASRGQSNPDFTFVVGARASRDCACNFKPVHQFHSAVMLDEKARGNLPNSGLYAFRKTVHGQQQLMLVRFDAMLLCSCLAEMKELADLPPKLGEIAILIRRKVSVTVHIYIVTRYKF